MPLKGDLQRRSVHADHERGQGLLPGTRADEGRPRPLLPRRREPCAAAPAAPALPHGAVPERGRRRVLPPEARPGEAPAVRRRVLRPVPERALDRLRRHRQQIRARMGRQPRLHRAAHLALARPGDREAGLPADRPRSERRRPVAVRAPDRGRRSRGHGRARAGVLPEDLRCDRAAHPGADQARAASSRRCVASRRPSPRRWSGASATRRSRRRRGASRTVAASSSTSARTRATRRSRPPTRCGRPPTRASRRRCSGRRSPTVDPAAFTIETMPERIAAGRRPDGRHVAPQGRACRRGSSASA